MAIAVVDTGLGNLRSVEKAVEAAAEAAGLPGGVVRRTSDPEEIRDADHLVVPGQGGFRDGARALQGGLGDALRESIRSGTPYLGICLGLQLLFDGSDEAPGVDGLGHFSGRVERLARGDGVKIPHMGWNQIDLVGGGHPCLGPTGTWFYFVHSYHAVPTDPSILVATARHGRQSLTAAVAHHNVLATQFHPEKSQRAGLALLQRFLRS